MSMVDRVMCFFTGHKDEPGDVYPEIYTDPENVEKVRCTVPWICDACGTTVAKTVDPFPEGHKALYIRRPSMFNDNPDRVRFGCWCGWVGRWTVSRDRAENELLEHTSQASVV